MLSPAYVEIKRGGGILVGAGMDGGLQGSITSYAAASCVTVGSNKPYAAMHQFSGTIPPKTAKSWCSASATGSSMQSVTIPARPYLGLSADDREEIERLTASFLRKLIS